jgi:hypothetical protein
MRKGFLLGKTTAPPPPPPPQQHDELWESVRRYCTGTIMGWHSAMYKFLDAHRLPISNKAIYLVMDDAITDYFNKTHASIGDRSDQRVNEQFDNFTRLAGGDLPCMFLKIVFEKLIMQCVAQVIAASNDFDLRSYDALLHDVEKRCDAFLGDPLVKTMFVRMMGASQRCSKPLMECIRDSTAPDGKVFSVKWEIK